MLYGGHALPLAASTGDSRMRCEKNLHHSSLWDQAKVRRDSLSWRQFKNQTQTETQTLITLEFSNVRTRSLALQRYV